MDVWAASDERRSMHAAKSRGPDAPTLASSWLESDVGPTRWTRRRRRLSSPALRGDRV